MPRKIIVLSMLLFCSLASESLFAQHKFERESRIKRAEVPAKALFFIDTLALASRIKWFAEEGLNTQSIEAKFKHQKQHYSIEFDTLGNLEDVEIEVKWSTLPVRLQDSIGKQFAGDCLKSKVEKVQLQYTGTEARILALLLGDSSMNGITLRYEVVVKCRHEAGVDLFEYLFSDSGAVLSSAKIVFKNSSHLEY